MQVDLFGEKVGAEAETSGKKGSPSDFEKLVDLVSRFNRNHGTDYAIQEVKNGNGTATQVLSRTEGGDLYAVYTAYKRKTVMEWLERKHQSLSAGRYSSERTYSDNPFDDDSAVSSADLAVMNAMGINDFGADQWREMRRRFVQKKGLTSVKELYHSEARQIIEWLRKRAEEGDA